MQKHNIIERIVRFLIINLAILSCFSCKTPQETVKTVNPLELLDNNSSFYLAIPVEQDKDLVKKMVLSNVQGISEKNAEQIVDRTEILYVGLNKKRRYTEVQLSAKCEVPKIAISKVFSKRNNFEEVKISFDDLNKEYSVYNRKDLAISFPANDIVILGRDLQFCLEKFAVLSSDFDLQSNIELNEKINSLNLNSSAFEWLNNNEGEVRFFAQKPQAFLQMLVGANLNFKLIYVKGSMNTDEKYPDQYLMNLEFEFRDSRLVNAAKGALSLAFGLTNSEVIQNSSTNLQIKNIKIGKKQLYKILVI